jgi:hypothetical protein
MQEQCASFSSGRRSCSLVIKSLFVPSLQHHSISQSISSGKDALIIY